MYQFQLIYEHNGEIATIEHEVTSCSINNTAEYRHCELEVPITASHYYEKLDVANIVIHSINLIHNDENAYESDYWNTMKRLHTYLTNDGIKRCTLELVHTDLELTE